MAPFECACRFYLQRPFEPCVFAMCAHFGQDQIPGEWIWEGHRPNYTLKESPGIFTYPLTCAVADWGKLLQVQKTMPYMLGQAYLDSSSTYKKPYFWCTGHNVTLIVPSGLFVHPTYAVGVLRGRYLKSCGECNSKASGCGFERLCIYLYVYYLMLFVMALYYIII